MKAKKILSLFLVCVMIFSTLCLGMTANAADITYSDVNDGMWSYGDIKYVTENGLMNGTGGTTFSPAVGVTRAMVVTVLYRAEQSPLTKFSKNFIDVTDGQYYSDAVIWAYDNSIVNGTDVSEWGEISFSPDRVITRQELATMFVRYAEYKGVITTNSGSLDKFTDKASVADWASDAMNWATSCGLINGTGTGNTLSPTLTATREQFAAIIHRFRTLEFDYSVKYNVPLVQSTYTEQPYPLVNDADVYVAVDGNDANPGTLDKPLATVQAVKGRIKELKAERKGEIVVAFKAGDYGVLTTTFYEESGGSADCPVTLCAYGDGEVYFTNGAFIDKNSFLPLDESDDLERFNQDEIANIMKIDLDTVPGGDKITSESQLFTNGIFCNLARVPNKDGMTDKYYPGFTSCVVNDDSPYTIEYVIEKGETGEMSSAEMDIYIAQDRLITKRVLKDKLASYKSLEGVQLIGYISKVWHQDRFTILSFDEATGLVIYDGRPPWGYYAMAAEQTQIYINNVSEELDYTGEYWIDHETNTLYVYNPIDNYYIATEGTFITTDYADYMSFVKLNFRCSMDSPMDFKYSDFITLDRCNISYTSGNDGLVVNKCLNFTMKNCEMSFTSGYGIFFAGADSNDRADAGYDYMTLESQNIVVENNLFHDVSLVDIHSDVAAIKFSSDIIGARVAHNEVYNASRHAISFGRTNYDILMEYNYFHHCMTNSADGGVIHNGRGMVGPTNVIRYNIFSDIVATHQGGTFGVYLDDFENDTEVYGNIFYNVSCAGVTNGGRDNNFHDNVLINAGGIRINYVPERLLAYYADEGNEYKPQYTDLLPKEGSPYYEIWREKCPGNYELDTDPAHADQPNSIFAPKNTVVNNYSFGEKFDFDPKAIAIGTIENNFEFSLEENPVFVNPALGDYSIKSGADIMDNYFAQIGRY